MDILHEIITATTTTTSGGKADDGDDDNASDDERKTIRSLDPTCGSGIFLALSLLIWGRCDANDGRASSSLGRRVATDVVEVTAINLNAKCAWGSSKNMKHVLLAAAGAAAAGDNEADESLVEYVVEDDAKSRWEVTLNSPAGLSSSLEYSKKVTIHAGDWTSL